MCSPYLISCWKTGEWVCLYDNINLHWCQLAGCMFVCMANFWIICVCNLTLTKLQIGPLITLLDFLFTAFIVSISKRNMIKPNILLTFLKCCISCIDIPYYTLLKNTDNSLFCVLKSYLSIHQCKSTWVKFEVHMCRDLPTVADRSHGSCWQVWSSSSVLLVSMLCLYRLLHPPCLQLQMQ